MKYDLPDFNSQTKKLLILRYSDTELQYVCEQPNISARIVSLRKLQKLSQADAAKGLNIPRSALSNLENNPSAVTEYYIKRFSEFYNIDRSILVDGAIPNYDLAIRETGLSQLSFNFFRDVNSQTPELIEPFNRLLEDQETATLLLEILYFYAYEDLHIYSRSDTNLHLGPSRDFLDEEMLVKYALADKVQLLLQHFRNLCEKERYQTKMPERVSNILRATIGNKLAKVEEKIEKHNETMKEETMTDALETMDQIITAPRTKSVQEIAHDLFGIDEDDLLPGETLVNAMRRKIKAAQEGLLKIEDTLADYDATEG